LKLTSKRSWIISITFLFLLVSISTFFSTGGRAQNEIGLPSEPQFVKLSANEDEVLITWAPPADNGGGTILEYRIYRNSYNNREPEAIVNGDTLQYTDTEVISGREYVYKITAVNEAGESLIPYSYTILVPYPDGPRINLEIKAGLISTGIAMAAAILGMITAYFLESRRMKETGNGEETDARMFFNILLPLAVFIGWVMGGVITSNIHNSYIDVDRTLYTENLMALILMIVTVILLLIWSIAKSYHSHFQLMNMTIWAEFGGGWYFRSLVLFEDMIGLVVVSWVISAVVGGIVGSIAWIIKKSIRKRRSEDDYSAVELSIDKVEGIEI